MIPTKNQNNDITSSIMQCQQQLANDTCQAMENGNIIELYSILDIDTGGETPPPPSSSYSGEDYDTNNSSATSTQKCQVVLNIFYSLIGYYSKDEIESSNSNNNNGLVEEELPPLSVKAHLLLRGLLRIPHDKYLIPW